MKDFHYKSSAMALFIAFFCIVTVLLVGNFSVRIANGNSDNVPVIYVNYMKNPLKYKGDVIETFADQMTLASTLNSVTVYANKYLGIPSEIPSGLFVFLQNVLLGFAFLVYMTKLLPKKTHPALWIVPIAIFLAAPWVWNISWYPDMTYIPYAGHLAAPFLVLAGAFVLGNQLSWAFVFLAIGALVHPSQTLHLSAILFFYWVLQLRDVRKLARPIGGLVAIGILCVVPALILAGPGFNPVSNAEIMPTILSNKHFVPWQNSVFWGWELPSTIGIALMALWVGHHLTFLKEKHRHFIYSNVAAAVLLSLAHIAAVHFQIVQVIQLCPLRVTVLTALFLAPIVFTYYVEKFLSKSAGVRMVGAGNLLFHSIFSFGFFWGPFLSLMLTDKKKTARRGVTFYVVWCALFLAAARAFVSTPFAEMAGNVRYILGPGIMTQFTPIRFIFLCILSGLLAIVSGKNQKWGNGLLLLFVSGCLIFKSYQSGAQTEEGFLKANYLAQVWASKNTLDSAIFLVDKDNPWRPLSERRVVNVRCEGMHMYTRNRQSKEFCDAVARFYKSENLTLDAPLGDSQILRFAALFGGDFAVRRASEPLALPEAYRNDGMIIYKLKGN